MLDFKTQQAWRQHLQISVCRLMLFVVTAGCGLGVVAGLVRNAETQRLAAAKIKQAGGTVLYDWLFRDGRTILNGRPPGPKWLINLLGVDYFAHVTFVRLPDLAEDREIVCAGSFSRLEILWNVPRTLTDAGLDHLTGLASLRHLSLQHTRVTDTGLPLLVRMKCLTGLSLRGTEVTDSGLAHLAALPGLTHLDLRETAVSDEGLVWLAQLRNLVEVDLDDTRVTWEGAEDLQRLLPKSKIIR